MSENKQFFIVPNNMTARKEIKPTDILIYLYLRSYDNQEHKCFPSLATLSKRSGAAINTIRSGIKHLEENGYIAVKKDNNRNYYYFSKEKEFQIFSLDFLNNDTLTFKEKAYIASAQQYMFKDIEGLGKISMPNNELAQVLNVSENTLCRGINLL